MEKFGEIQTSEGHPSIRLMQIPFSDPHTDGSVRLLTPRSHA